MSKEYCVVTTIKDGVVDKHHLFVSENGFLVDDFMGRRLSDLPEQEFLRQCNNLDPEFSSHDEEDVETLLDQGYFEFENGSVCISWVQDVN